MLIIPAKREDEAIFTPLGRKLPLRSKLYYRTTIKLFQRTSNNSQRSNERDHQKKKKRGK